MEMKYLMKNITKKVICQDMTEGTVKGIQLELHQGIEYTNKMVGF